MSAWTPRVGMKVVCIKKGRWTGDDEFGRSSVYPIYGSIYTISAIYTNQPEGDFLQFVEIPTHCATGFSQGWWVVHFRPLQKRKTSIEQFRKILVPSEELEDA